MARRIRAATRQDVATRAGVAPSTVSLVLNCTPGPRIPEDTRARVMAAAKELGYQSSSIARALVTGKTNTFGVVMHFVERPFHSYVAGVLDGFWATMIGHGYRMLMVNGTPNACTAGLYRERSVDGMLVFAAPIASDDDELRAISRSGFPTVFVGTMPEAARGKADYVDIDNILTARKAVDALIAAGHRDILHLAGPLAVNSAAVDRRKGYLEALKAAGIPAREELIIDCSFNQSFVAERMGKAMDAGLRFTAIFAANLGMARGAVLALRARGLDVPKDISLVSIDADPSAESSAFHITTYAQPLDRVGAEAARLLLDRMKGKLTGAGRSTLFPCDLVAGQSIRAI